MDMLSGLNDYLKENKFNQRNVKQSVISHLCNLSQWLDKYFPKTLHHNNMTGYYHPLQYHLSSDLIEALDDLSSDHSLKIVFDTKRTLTEF